MAAFARTGRSIVAIGRNYAQHAAELGNKAPTEPFYFLKPTSSYLPSGGQIRVPKGIHAHYEGLSRLKKSAMKIDRLSDVAHIPCLQLSWVLSSALKLETCKQNQPLIT